MHLSILLALTCVIGCCTVVGEADAQDLSKKEIQRILGVPTQNWICPKQGSKVRFRPERVGRKHSSAHTLGKCFQTIKSKTKEYYKIWVPAVDAVIASYLLSDDLAPMVQTRSRLNLGPKDAGKTFPNQPGIYLSAGTPVARVTKSAPSYVEDEVVTAKVPNSTLLEVRLPPGDVVGSGWIRIGKLKISGRRNHSRSRRRASSKDTERIWIPGKADLLANDSKKIIATLARSESLVSALQLAARNDQVLVKYVGQHAEVIGWISANRVEARHQPSSEAEVGLAEAQDSMYWVGAGEQIFDRPSGQIVGVFQNDTELVGRGLKNGWIKIPVVTEMGTLNLWSPIYSKHEM